MRCLVAFAIGLLLSADDGENPLRVYEVGKTVAEFPDQYDFSRPETAYALVNRVMADGNGAAWRHISAKALADRLPPSNAKKQEVSAEVAAQWLDARIVEVRVFREVYAAVIAEIPGEPRRFDIRHFALEKGRWLNRGQDISGSLEQARERFARGCSLVAEAPTRPKIEDPDAHLDTFVEFLKKEAKDPKALLMDALESHEVVILGEIHHRPRYWSFNTSLVEDPGFAERVGVIYMELPLNDQVLIDRFLAAGELDTAPVIEMLRDVLWMGWPDQPMLEFFEAVWRVNQALPVEKRLRIVLADMQRPWRDIKVRTDLRKYEVDRDKFMADNIVADLRAHDDGRNALFIVGAAHTMLNLRYVDGATPMRSAGWHLRKQLGPENVFAVFPHTPVQTNMGRVDGRVCRGLFDAAFAAIDNRPIAFPLDKGPFGAQPFDAFPDMPSASRYRDGYSAYLYLGPLEDEIFSPLIPGFYTDDFVHELDRRHRLTFGAGLVQAYNLDSLTADSFIKWMSTNWGQPRRSWQRLGPPDAWRNGD